MANRHDKVGPIVKVDHSLMKLTRESQGMTHDGLSEATGCSVGTIRNFERRGSGRYENAKVIAEKLDLPLHRFILSPAHDLQGPHDQTDFVVVPYGSDAFGEWHKKFMGQQPSELLVNSYTGQTTDQLVNFLPHRTLNMRFRLLVRHPHHEEFDERRYNESHPDGPAWNKTFHIKHTARFLSRVAWTRQGGGHVHLEQRFFDHDPLIKLILYLAGNEPYAGFFGFYKPLSEITGDHHSRFVIDQEPVKIVQCPGELAWYKAYFEHDWSNAETFEKVFPGESAGRS